jgi:hypothetical protein
MRYHTAATNQDVALSLLLLSYYCYYNTITDPATAETAVRVSNYVCAEKHEEYKDTLLHRALKLPEGEIIFREAVTESLSLHCPQQHTKANSTAATTTADTTDVAATTDAATATATATADATTATTADATSGSSTAMAVDTTTANSGTSISNGSAAAVATQLSTMAVDDTTTTATTTVNNAGNDATTSDSRTAVDAPKAVAPPPTVIKEAPQLLLVPGHDCEPESFPVGLLFGAAHALPTAFVLERVLLASALRRSADLPCAVADTEVTVIPVTVVIVIVVLLT